MRILFLFSPKLIGKRSAPSRGIAPQSPDRLPKRPNAPQTQLVKDLPHTRRPTLASAPRRRRSRFAARFCSPRRIKSRRKCHFEHIPYIVVESASSSSQKGHAETESRDARGRRGGKIGCRFDRFRPCSQIGLITARAIASWSAAVLRRFRRAYGCSSKL